MMKKFLTGLALLPLFFAFFAHVAGVPAECAEAEYKTYVNDRFGYSVNYPDIFESSREPDNGDGIEFASDDGEYTLTIWGGYNVLGQDGYALLEECYERVAHIVPDSQESAGNYYSIEYSDDGGKDGVEHIFHEYGIVNEDMKASFTLQYPKAEEKRFATIKIDMENSLGLPESEGASNTGEAPDIGAFALKDGRVYKNDTELDCEANEIPSQVEGPIRFWSAIDDNVSERVSENEAGVYFFAADGVCLTFLPLEAASYSCQNLLFSPDGERFLLMEGSGVRPDMTYILYELPDMEKKTEIGGLREEHPFWIDPMRFVMTRIDDGIREGMSFANLSYGLRLSVVMVDASVSETTVLKGATDTANYTMYEVTDDGNVVTVIEESVKSEKDWAVEDQIETREIRVEIPAAG
jgi:hypothetical protein